MNPVIHRRAACLLMLPLLAPAIGRAAAQVSPLEIGVLPNISARTLLVQYQPMREFLARTARREVQVSTAPNWAQFHQRTAAGEYDLVVTAIHLARLAQLDAGYRPLLAYAPDIKGLVVSPSNRPLPDAAALRGQTLVLSNPQSLVTLRGIQWLADNGLQRERDYRTIGTPTDDSVGNVVLRGDAAAAMLSGGELRAIPDTLKAQLKVLTTFAEVPGFVVMASPRLAAAEAHELKALLLQFAAGSDEGRSFFAATGFTALRELAPGAMEAMDPWVERTRRVLAAPA